MQKVQKREKTLKNKQKKYKNKKTPVLTHYICSSQSLVHLT